MANLLNALQSATTLDDVKKAVVQAELEELDARKGHEAVINAFSRCAREIDGARSVIVVFLHNALAAKTVTDINALARNFQEEIAAVVTDDASAVPDRTTIVDAGGEVAADMETPRTRLIKEMLLHPDDMDTRRLYADALDDEGFFAGATLTRIEHELRTNKQMNRNSRLEACIAAKHDHTVEILKRFFFDPSLWPDDWKEDGVLNNVGTTLPEKAIVTFARLAVPKQVEILEMLLRLPEQFANNLSSLRRTGLLRKEKGMINDAGRWRPATTRAEMARSASISNEGYVSEDGRWHRLTYSESDDPRESLLAQLHGCDQEHRTQLFQRALQGFDRLIVTPRLGVQRLTNALQKRLEENAQRIPGGLNPEHPLIVDEIFDPSSEDHIHLLYHGDGVDTGHSLVGGFDIALVEDNRTFPLEGTETVAAGYPFLGNNLRASDYLDLINGRENARAAARGFDASNYRGLIGWTPQMYCAADMLELDRSGRPLDQNDEPFELSYLPGASVPVTGELVSAMWMSQQSALMIAVVERNDRNSMSGVRLAVRV